ncbi:Nucleoporin Nup43 [Orchesella cincta]|uniref:Nucleoporin Nup43 n=1 Tax=Orchesella cincta TaxID=48709 RepID=A0A1D2M999_ORCCI|nr:Nucleoporin Nup43 [Orchesella cincta]
MNSSMMIGGMDSSLYMDSTTARTLNRSRAAPSAKPKFVRFTNSTQTGRNVSKVRWLLDNSYIGVPDPYASEFFVSGSWSSVGDENDVGLWSLEVGPSAKEGEKDAKVTLITKAIVKGNVTDMSSLCGDRFCLCTSDGALYVYKCNKNRDEKFVSVTQAAASQLFTYRGQNSSATAVAVKDDIIVAAGEDGSIIECNSAGLGVIRRLERVDPLSISSACFVGRETVMTGNGGGQLKLWDLRSDSDVPVQILNPNVLMNNLYGASSICQHPSQTHAIIVGYQSGCMDLWDMRLGPDSDPVANLTSEGGALSEIYFHQINSDHFFSCAQSGQVCHWYPAERLSNPLQVPVEYSSDLNIEFLKKGLVFKEVHTSPFPINSMSLSRNDRIVVGSDSGVVFCTEIRV